MTIPPAITRTSLFASAIVLPHSMAANTASRPSVPDEAHRDEIDIGMRRHRRQALASRSDDTGTSRTEPPELIDRGIRGHRNDARPILFDLFGEQGRVLARRQPDDLQAVGYGIHDSQRALANRSRRSKNGDAFHGRLTIYHGGHRGHRVTSGWRCSS